ncbi:hypothetical protein DFP72DRAFT_1065184 [Ephemerocybe angulata]|uniref:Secreted protein n=1 Tax=Ephemerocybe angulata TaxID=980116 RepID=A0A8H6M9J6_9AGAR|nr:hypothetical protein DFP72DRAFT_1065184 [Tulosesus angulatus]
MVNGIFKFTLVLCLGLQASAQSLTLTKAGLLGTGCSVSSATARIRDGVVSIEANNFGAYSGPGMAYSSSRKNCQATLSVNIPDGYQFAFGETRLPAAVRADKGTQVSASNLYYFQGEITQDEDTSTVPAGTSGTVTLVNSYGPSTWSSCGGAAIVNLNTALRAHSTDKSASGSIKLRGSLDTKIVWRKC